MELQKILQDLANWFFYKKINLDKYKFSISEEIYDFVTYNKIDMLYLDFYEDNFQIDNNFYYNLLINKRKKVIESNSIQIKIAEQLCYDFIENKISVLFLKGLPLLINHYNKIYQRYFGDIDILIDKSNIKKVELLLSKKGYQYGNFNGNKVVLASKEEILFQKMYTHEIFNMVKVINRGYVSNIDVNFKFSWVGCDNKFSDIPFNILIEHSLETKINKTWMSTLNRELSFIHLCCHFYNEAVYFLFDNDIEEDNDTGELLLFRLFDILLICIKPMNIQLIYDLSKKYLCLDQIKFVLTVIAEIFGSKILNIYNEKFGLYDVHDINYYINKNNQKIFWPIDLKERVFDLEKKRNISKNIY